MFKKVLFYILLIGTCTGPQYAKAVPAPFRVRQAIYLYAKAGDVRALKALQARGISLEARDGKGNTALCEATWRKDRVAFQALRSAGANLGAACMNRIPASYKTAMGLSPATGTGAGTTGAGLAAATTAETAGLSTAAMVGIGVGAVALVGGGVALAAGGGGGGSSSKGDKPQDTGGETCAGYALTTCPANGDCDTCTDKDGNTRYTLTKCHAGYDRTGNTCVAHNCAAEGYRATACTANETPTGTCRSGASTWYKCQAKPVDKCENVNCGAHGTCSDGMCVCSDNYYGPRCETAPLNCGAHGTWNPATKACDCSDGYTGTICQTAPVVDKCENVNCGAHGTCLEGMCVCSDNYYGPRCETAPLNCGAHGTWNPATKACDCSDGYTGTTCQTAPVVDKCENINCGAHGTCSDGMCVCSDNYYGPRCETAPLNCGDHGTWNPATKACDCSDGYTGTTCQTAPVVDKCAGITCQGGGTCNSDTGMCACDATQGWVQDGQNCKPATCAGEALTACPSHKPIQKASCISGGQQYLVCEEAPACPAGQYGDGTTCTQCPSGSTSAAGATQISDCTCPDQWQDPNTFQCYATYTCLHGGKQNGPTSCDCTGTGYTGTLCEIIGSGTGTQPDLADPVTWQTSEFKKGNFLSQIGADKAYARGYTGLVHDPNTRQPTTEKVRVGVLDSGVDITHQDLIDNLSKDADGNIYGFNFDYGPCKGSDKKNCYSHTVSNGTHYVTFLDENGNAKNSAGNYYYRGTISAADWNTYANAYADDYDWDKEKYNPNPHKTGSDGELNGHGTHVAGIIGAAKDDVYMHGVAPNVEMVAGIYDTRFTGFSLAAKTFADQRVRVINMSFGLPASYDDTTTQVQYAKGKNASNIYYASEVAGYKTLVANNIVTVKSAGNDSAPDKHNGKVLPATVDLGVPLTTTFGKGSQYDMTNLFVAVAALNYKNGLASYSQSCGAAQGYCISAPGGDPDTALAYAQEMYDNGTWTYDYANTWYKEHRAITSTIPGGEYGELWGTSMATPVVTGSIALLMGAYPWLSSQEVVDLLFMTANQDLPDWVDSVTYTSIKTGETKRTSTLYGHGMVDLDKATGSAIGDLYVTTGTTTNANRMAIKQASFKLPRRMSTALMQNMPAGVMALDAYERPFMIRMDTLVKRPHRSEKAFRQSFRSFLSRGKIQTAGVPDKLSFTFATTPATDNLLGYGALDMNLALSDTQALRLSYRADTRLGEDYFNQVLSNPFTEMRNSYALAHTFKLNKKWGFTFGAITGKNGFFDADKDYDTEFKKSVNAFSGEVSYQPSRRLTLKAVGGMVSEKDAILGMNGAGAFKTDTGTTYYTGAVAEIYPTQKLTLSAAWYYGHSVMNGTDSLLSFGRLESDSFALDARYQATKDRLFGLQVSSPLRIRKGTATFLLPTGRGMYDDTVYTDTYRVSLKSTAREYNVGLYMTETGKTFDWRYELGVRFHPDHDATAAPDYRALFGFDWKY